MPPLGWYSINNHYAPVSASSPCPMFDALRLYLCEVLLLSMEHFCSMVHFPHFVTRHRVEQALILLLVILFHASKEMYHGQVAKVISNLHLSPDSYLSCSLLTNHDIDWPVSRGMEDIVAFLRELVATYGVGRADIIQFSAGERDSTLQK